MVISVILPFDPIMVTLPFRDPSTHGSGGTAGKDTADEVPGELVQHAVVFIVDDQQFLQ